MGVELFGDWERLEKTLDPIRFREALRKEVSRAKARIGARFVREARKRIQRGDYAANSMLTQALKGSSKPLVNDGDLMGSLTWRSDPQDPLAVWLGVNRIAGDSVNIARLLHDGFYLRITAKSSRYLFVQLQKAAKKGGERGALAQQILASWKSKPKGGSGAGKLSGPSKKRARALYFGKIRKPVGGAAKSARRVRVPPRPFVHAVILDPEFRAYVIEQWREAVRRAMVVEKAA